jgi:hypothetical protein
LNKTSYIPGRPPQPLGGVNDLESPINQAICNVSPTPRTWQRRRTQDLPISAAWPLRGLALAGIEPLCKPRDYTLKEAGSHSHFTPDGWHTMTPRIVVHDAERQVGFLRRVFGATGGYRPDLPSEIKIGDSIVMVSDAGIRKPMPAFLYVYVHDTDETYRRALQVTHCRAASVDCAPKNRTRPARRGTDRRKPSLSAR